VFFVCLRFVHPMLTASVDCPFSIALRYSLTFIHPSVICNTAAFYWSVYTKPWHWVVMHLCEGVFVPLCTIYLWRFRTVLTVWYCFVFSSYCRFCVVLKTYSTKLILLSITIVIFLFHIPIESCGRDLRVIEFTTTCTISVYQH
jgi:hypothetical protein